MGRINTVLLAVLVAFGMTAVIGAGQSGQSGQGGIDRQTLGRQIEQRFEVLPVQGGVLLKPKRGNRDIRSIELTNGAIAIDGQPVSGAELKRRVEADADLIIRLSYLDASEQRALFEPRPSQPVTPPAPTAGAADQPVR